MQAKSIAIILESGAKAKLYNKKEPFGSDGQTRDVGYLEILSPQGTVVVLTAEDAREIDRLLVGGVGCHFWPPQQNARSVPPRPNELAAAIQRTAQGDFVNAFKEGASDEG
jgi:hypothetical protein